MLLGNSQISISLGQLLDNNLFLYRTVFSCLFVYPVNLLLIFGNLKKSHFSQSLWTGFVPGKTFINQPNQIVGTPQPFSKDVSSLGLCM